MQVEEKPQSPYSSAQSRPHSNGHIIQFLVCRTYLPLIWCTGPWFTAPGEKERGPTMLVLSEGTQSRKYFNSTLGLGRLTLVIPTVLSLANQPSRSPAFSERTTQRVQVPQDDGIEPQKPFQV